MFSWPSTASLILYLVIGLVSAGVLLSLLFVMVKGLLFTMYLAPSLAARAWAWLTGKPPTSYGSAHLASVQEIDAKGLFTPGSIPLGTYQGRTLYESFGGHVALIGPPRSRKSWGLIMPAIEAWAWSLVVNDMRGELHTHTATARQAKGPTYRFSPTQRSSCALNILDAVRWGHDEQYGDVQRCVHGLMSPEPGEVQSHFSLEGEPLLVALIMDRQSHGEGSLPAVVRWMSAPGMSMKDKAKTLLQSPLLPVQAGGRRLLDKSDNEASAVWSSVLAALTIYMDPLVAANCSHSDVDLSELQDGLRPVSLFLTPPFADVARLRPLLGTLVEMLTARFSAQRADAPRQRVLLCLDEAMNLGKLPELERGMSYLQGCAVQVFATLQNLLQFAQTYGPHSPLLASISTQVYYTPSLGDRDTARHLSDAMGLSTEARATETQTVSFWGFLQRKTFGEQQHQRQLMNPDEVTRLPEDNCIVLVKGCAPILGRKLGAPEPLTIATATHRYGRAGIAAGVVIALLTTGVAYWQIGRSPTPAPSLTLTTPAIPEAAATATPARRNPWGDWAMPSPIIPHAGWGLWKVESGYGTFGGMSGGAEQTFGTLDACEEGKAQSLRMVDATMFSGMRPTPGLVREPWGYTHDFMPGAKGLGKRRVVYLCSPTGDRET